MAASSASAKVKHTYLPYVCDCVSAAYLPTADAVVQNNVQKNEGATLNRAVAEVLMQRCPPVGHVRFQAEVYTARYGRSGSRHLDDP
jgi:hypothetical protein